MPTSTPPDPITPPLGAPWSNTPASSIVLPGVAVPVAGVTAPTVTAVEHTTTLSAGVNYLVSVVSRLAPVTIALPDPGSAGQVVEVTDASRQAGTFAVTITAGTKTIERGGNSYTLTVNGSAVRLAYVADTWKIL